MLFFVHTNEAVKAACLDLWVKDDETVLMRKILLIVLALCAVLFGPQVSAAGTIPFGPGEKLTYEIHWTFIHAGDAVLEVMPTTEVDGVPAMYFKATATTVPWVDKFYKVRDVLEAWTDLDVTHSLRYKKDQNEGSYHKKVELVFDKKTNQSKRYVSGELKHTIDQPVNAFDPMSILFSFRKQILYKTMQFGANVSDGKKSVVGEATVEAMETIETGIGRIETFRVRLDIKHLSGVFKKSKDAELLVWFSADARRIPVKVKSKVKVGHFTMELVDYTSPTPSVNIVSK